MSFNSNLSMAAKTGIPSSNLCEEELITLLKRSKKGDLDARNQILLANIGLIITLAKKVTSSIEKQKYLVVNGCIRFLEIINDYNPSKGKLSTYIWHPVLEAMHEGVDGYNKTLGSFIRAYNYTVDSLSMVFNRNPTTDEIADFMGISMKVLQKRLLALNNRVNISFDTPLSSEEGEGDSLLNNFKPEIYEDSSAETLKNEERRLILLAWGQLSDSERSILLLRSYKNGHRVSLRNAEEKTGLSKETIRCRENSAKHHFSKILNDYGIYAA